MPGLRTRKKQQTYDALSAAAIALFLERGFDQVSVADIAAAANVSKPTLFKYFATKQDLVLHRIADHAHESARLLQEANAGAIPAEGRVAWAAGILRDAFVAGLDRRDPVTGLNDDPEVLAYYRLVFETPTLAIRVQQFIAEDQTALADALGNDLTAEVAAAQLISTQQVLARRNYRAMAGGITAAKQYPTAHAEALTAYSTFPGTHPTKSNLRESKS
ncbi:TetR family transcriptional regulator [Kribbella qitaiheensis]|uniref:TetR family transcriptional regulator n=1 Tax=Kribbella qitaiheensis TaxID=1544730 RepID=A0A7G6WRQ2_9ACTN|nr:TetR/AcrR family transcriptional regulator [Kribbella qitaiheensis]QNE16667.1 TetR family transcriptional regulator [Kribbella qitaiheensis]